MNRGIMGIVSQLLVCGEYNGCKTGNACSKNDRNDTGSRENLVASVITDVPMQEWILLCPIQAYLRIPSQVPDPVGSGVTMVTDEPGRPGNEYTFRGPCKNTCDNIRLPCPGTVRRAGTCAGGGV